MDTKKKWFVTGASKGLGLNLVKTLLNNGHQVAATSRNLNALIEAVKTSSSNFLPLEMDLLDEDSVADALSKTKDTFGQLDVVVNNAGYGQLGTLEELTNAEARENFDVNVFGVLNVIRKAMPFMRTQKSGHFINISSIAGFVGSFPGWGIYCATKYALAGLTESFSAEIKSLGLTATVVYPGYFRTNFLNQGSLVLPQNEMSIYKEARDLQQVHLDDIAGNQTGDPEKAAAVLMQLAEMEHPPLHLFLGTDANQYAQQKMETLENEMALHKELATATDY
ncbi:SDR family oxidoreductase [Leeuwenhoekiella polynyae]|uniref:NADP-dependent 3-hydroxy acid dehydrogenase YdfG n=1 Tax=Leeuwenhoekiella polynyae TaxID=1550906 RepID=A0A4V1KRW0_9FLAO|nr:SDR family oxidoreductase [Leeuwenhoekiella polynyae]RXG26284.1 NADP-dependent 3-hydroxy acid dehydrogenase YdfG [Leeuwenhoekiella polynyae]